MNKSHLAFQKHKGSFSNLFHFQHLHRDNKIISLPYGLRKKKRNKGILTDCKMKTWFSPHRSSVYFPNPVLLRVSGVNNCIAKWFNTVASFCWAAADLLETTAASSGWSHEKRRLCYGTAILCCSLYPPFRNTPVMGFQVFFSEMCANVLLICLKHKEPLHST